MARPYIGMGAGSWGTANMRSQQFINPAFGPDGKVIPFDERGQPGATALGPNAIGGEDIIPGAPPRGYNPASGGVPGVTSPISTVTGNLGGINDIIGGITGQQNEALRDQYPEEYFGILGTLLGNTQRRARGDISDLLPELQQRSAEGAVTGGFSGSGMENTKLLRDLGLTRYGVENQALRDLGIIQSEIPLVRPYDPSGIIASQLGAQERADVYASAPIPEAAYQRALAEANRGNVGGGGGGGSLRPPTGRVGTADAALRSSGVDPYARVPGKPREPFFWGPQPDVIPELPQMAPQTAQNYQDFEPWFASMLDVGGGLNFANPTGQPTSPLNFGGGIDYGGGEGFFGGGEDFGFNTGSVEDYYDDFLYEQGF